MKFSWTGKKRGNARVCMQEFGVSLLVSTMKNFEWRLNFDQQFFLWRIEIWSRCKRYNCVSREESLAKNLIFALTTKFQTSFQLTSCIIITIKTSTFNTRLCLFREVKLWTLLINIWKFSLFLEKNAIEQLFRSRWQLLLFFNLPLILVNWDF